MKKLYVGNLPFSCRDEDLRAVFAEYGTVASAEVITDRESGRSRGFGFVTFEKDAEAKAAIEGTNGKDVNGRPLIVNVARPLEKRERRF